MTRIGPFSVLPICLGGNVFGWTADERTSHAILDAFVDGGGSFIDTADAYSAWIPGNHGGESETIIGSWLAHRSRHEVVIATKVAKYAQRPGLSPRNIRAALDDSRRRLGIDTIDLYYAHEDDPSVPLADTLGTFDELIKDGAITTYGLSNYSVARIKEALVAAEAHGYAEPVAIQPHYSLVHRADVESSGMAALAVARGIALVPYYGLASGFLTGKYRRGFAGKGARLARASHYFTEDGFATLDVLVEIADVLGVEPASVALAWLAHRPGVAAPIASASRPEQVPALLTGAKLTLSPDHVSRLTAVSTSFA